MLLADARYAVRTLRKSPVFTVTTILIMTLTIGANTAIFSVVNTVLIRALPFAAPDGIVQVAERTDRLGIPSFSASVLASRTSAPRLPRRPHHRPTRGIAGGTVTSRQTPAVAVGRVRII